MQLDSAPSTPRCPPTRPATIGAHPHRLGYGRGLQQFGWLGLGALALLIVGALWEAFSLLYLVHPPSELLL